MINCISTVLFVEAGQLLIVMINNIHVQPTVL